MSGPKGYNYSVVSPQELARRELAAVNARCDSLRTTLAELNGKLRHFGRKSVVRPKATGTSLASMRQLEHDLRSAIDDATKMVNKAAAEELVNKLHAEKAAVKVSGVKLSRPANTALANQAAPNAQSQEADERANLEIEKLLKHVASIQDTTIREALGVKVRNLAKASDVQQVKADIQLIKNDVTKQLERQRIKAKASEMVLAIAHLDSPAAEQLRLKSQQAQSQKEIDDLESDIAALLASDVSAADAKFVQQALSEALEEIGLELGSGFETTEFGAVTVAELDDHPGYRLRLQVNPSTGMILTRVVAEAYTLESNDIDAEGESCAIVADLTKSLESAGIATTLKVQNQPGDVAVTRVEKFRSAPQKRKKSRRVAKPREQSA